MKVTEKNTNEQDTLKFQFLQATGRILLSFIHQVAPANMNRVSYKRLHNIDYTIAWSFITIKHNELRQTTLFG